MRFADELVDVEQFDFPGDDGIRKPELDMAKALVNSLAAEWDPAKYTDQYRENLLRIIQAQDEGQEGRRSSRPPSRAQAEVVDLMERLRRSLEQVGAAAGKSAPRRTRAARRRSGHEGAQDASLQLSAIS